MKLRVTMNSPVGREPVVGIELEADGWDIVPSVGTLTIRRANEPLVVYAPGVWRSIADVGALAAAVAAARPKQEPSENSGRTKEARQATEA